MVTTFTQLLHRRFDTQLGQSGTQYISFAVEGATRMEQLLHDLRDYWRVSEHDDKVEHMPVDMNQVLNQVVANLASAIRESGATITRGALPVVAGERGAFVQLLQNLMSNAIKYRVPGRTPEVHVGASRKGTEWVFCVRDNGEGIAPQYHQTIFGIFKRLHARQVSGTGIGLALCQKIVERHGGHIWVESEPGRGSTFFFTVPVRGTLMGDDNHESDTSA
jgi:light-regulated signal transduction histidine kinase (bacteriophytochrome)